MNMVTSASVQRKLEHAKCRPSLQCLIPAVAWVALALRLFLQWHMESPLEGGLLLEGTGLDSRLWMVLADWDLKGGC